MTHKSHSLDRPLFEFQRIETHAPWSAVLFPVSGFPAPAEDMAGLGHFLQELTGILIRTENLNLELLLQVWKMSSEVGGNVVTEHASDWWPTLGCGVWPDREAPRAWTDEMASDAAAAMFRGDELPLASHKLLHLTAEKATRMDVAETLQGLGILIQMLSGDTFEALERRGRDTFLPTIKEARFRRQKFYLPVLDAASIAAARDAEQLDTWLCGADVYMRESPEDKGFLILSKRSLESAFKMAEEQVRRPGGLL